MFVVATANDITSLPPELLRKGRFDEVFRVDFPDETEREAILRVHLENGSGVAESTRGSWHARRRGTREPTWRAWSRTPSNRRSSSARAV